MKVLVETVVTQLIEVPDDATEMDLRMFLGDYQSFNDAFAGVSDQDQKFRILNLVPEVDTILEWGVEE